MHTVEAFRTVVYLKYKKMCIFSITYLYIIFLNTMQFAYIFVCCFAYWLLIAAVFL